MINYPNGQKIKVKVNNNVNKKHIFNAANRGMHFENEINISNDFYINNKIALITKRPTPINVVKVDYSKGAKIIDAYFEKQSTTDYNGVYKGYYLDFEAKSTNIKTSFPLNNITPHQIKHLENVLYHKGIAFFLIQFVTLNEVYYLDAKYVINHYKHSERRSIPINDVRKFGHLIKLGYLPRYNYLEIVDKYLQ